MPISVALNQRSVLALVACDFSYISEAQLQDELAKLRPVPLATFQDSTPENNKFPLSLAVGAQLITTEVQILNRSDERAFGDWSLRDQIYDSQTGFSALFFYSAERHEYIVALTGTNGADLQDLQTDITFAASQWAANEDRVRQRIALLAEDPQFASAHVTFTGQSLGGALAQFAAYDFIEQNPALDRGNLSLVTFNGLGAFGGMRELRPAFSPTRLAGIETAHYAVFNDIVHRLGEGNFNAANNTYLLDFRVLPGQTRALGIVDSHRIEAGFYRGFGWPDVSLVARDLGWGSFRTAAKPYDIDYIITSEAQRLASTFGQLFNDEDHSPFESAARMVAGITHGLRTVPLSELHAASTQLIEHWRRSSTNAESYATWFLTAAALTGAAKAAASSPAGTLASIYGLALGIGWDVGEDLAGKDTNMRDRLARLLPADQYNFDLAQSIVSERDFARSMFKAIVGLKIVDGSILKGLPLDYDPSQILSAAFTQQDWLPGTLRRLAERARDSGGSLPKVAVALAEEAVALAKSLGTPSDALADEVVSEVSDFLGDVAKGIANAHQDLITKIVDSAFDLQRSLGFAEGRSLLEQLKERFQQSRDKDVRSAIEDAIETIEFGGQSIVLRAGASANPLNASGVDPNRAPTDADIVQEGGRRLFTLYLAYEAPTGGQRVVITASGTDAHKLRLNARGEVPNENGTFTITIPEGSRQLSVVVSEFGDIDEDSQIQLSAHLADATDAPTHESHLEATISLEAFDEPSDPATTNLVELLSAGGAEGPGAEYFDTPDPDRIFIREDNDSANDYLNYDAVAFHANEFGGRPSGSSDWVTTFSGRDVIYLGAGDDLIETGTGGSVLGDAGGDIVHAGAGDDRIYGNEVVDTEVAIAEGEAGEASTQQGDALSGGVGDDLAIGTADRDLLTGGGGADVLIGGAGNDYLLGDTDYETRIFNWGVTVDGAGTDNRSYEFFVMREVEVLPDPQGDRLYGGAGDDVAFGEGGDDFIDLGTGSDHGIGGEGDDIILGGAGEDLLVGEDDGDFLDGGEDADHLFGGEGADVLYGGDGDDLLQGDSDDQGAGEDYLDGEDGNDVLVAGGQSDVLYGGAGDDELHGDGSNVDLTLQGADELFGEDGNDILVGYDGDDLLDGGEGDDFLAGGEGIDELSGGDGNDRILGDDEEDEDEGGDADFIDGGSGDDSIEAHGGDDFVLAGEGDDFVDAGSGADYVEAGDGDDSVHGGGGDDELIGGSGDDSLFGGTGADVYRYALGDGMDRINDAGELGGLVDTLSFGAGISFADTSFSRGWDGELTIRLADGGAVGIEGMFSDPWARIERITFEDGTILAAEDLDDLPIGVLFGTDGDDILVGTENIDTLVAGEGADVLDGGQGNDILEGGTGVDVYNVGLTSGLDTIIERAGETSVIALAAGLALGDLRAARSGDDLTLTVRGTGNAVTVQDYFTAAQEISVLDAAGTSLSAAQLLEISAEEGETRETLKSDFRVRAKVDFFGRYFTEGYEFVNANTAARTSTSPVTIGVDRHHSHIVTDITYLDGRPGETLVFSHDTIELLPGSPGSILYEALQYVHQVTESDEPFIFPETQDGVAELVSEQTVALDWLEGNENQYSHTFHTESGFVTDQTLPPGQQTIGIAVSFITDDHFFRGNVGRIVMAGGAPPPPVPYLPAVEVVDRVDRTTTQTINEVLAGPGDNAIGGAYIADGGAGNDTISGDGLLLGGEGDDSLFGTGSLYGEDGNDFIIGAGYLDGGHGDDQIFSQASDGGSVMAPGSGNDLVLGSRGRDVVRIGADDTGSKILWDEGSVVDYGGEGGIPFFVQYYEGLGITNWPSLPEDQLPVVSADDFALLAQMFDYAYYPADLVELPAGASLASLDVAWGFVDLYALGVGASSVQLSLDLSWGTDATVRIVLPNASQSTIEDFQELVGNGFERVRLGDGTVLGVDQLVALAPAELPRRPVPGTEFDDTLNGWEGDDDIEGLAGDDQLIGNGGSDTFHGGPGWDQAEGGTGDDRYVYFLGDDIDDVSDAGGTDAVVFGEGIAPEDVLVTRDPYGRLYLQVGGPQNRVELSDWFTSDSQIEQVQFADGTVWDATGIESRVITAPATELDDIVYAGGGDDVIDALAGNDRVYGNAGNDILAGGEGDDELEGSQGSNLLLGGAGNDALGGGAEPGHHFFIGGAGDDFINTGAAGDIVAFNAGDGNDTILAFDAMTLSLGGGIGAADLSLTYDDFGLALNVADGDSIRLWTQPQITLQLFGSVHAYDLSGVINEFYAQWNGEPGAVFALADVLPAYQTGFSETEALGGAIAWQYATTGNLDGLTGAQVQSVLADPGFGVAAQPIVVDDDVNHAPTVAHAIADQSFAAGAAFTFAVPADTFSDADANDTLSLTARLFGGGALPAWLTFDAASGSFNGSPQAASIGVLHLEVTATDAAGSAVVDDFGLMVRAADGATVNGRKGDDVIHGGSGNETLIAKGGSDYVYGDAGDDVLRGGAGNDVLQGGEGSDELRSGSGQNVLDGGAGADVLHGGQGSAFLAGGAGNDEIRVGRGADVIVFNAGDGIDTLFGGRDGGNTLSFGGGIGYDDLSFSKSGHDLVLNAGENDRMVLKNWYRGNHSVQNLQVILDATEQYAPESEDALYNKRVQIFDMWSLVAQFNQALAANPQLDSWSIMNGIAGAPAQVASSDDSAIGGDLAYWYGRNRTLAGISLAAAQEILGAPGFGADAQSLRPFDGLQEGFVRLR